MMQCENSSMCRQQWGDVNELTSTPTPPQLMETRQSSTSSICPLRTGEILISMAEIWSLICVLSKSTISPCQQASQPLQVLYSYTLYTGVCEECCRLIGTRPGGLHNNWAECFIITDSSTAAEWFQTACLFQLGLMDYHADVCLQPMCPALL